MHLYAIRCLDNGIPTGWVIGPYGPLTFTRKRDAEREAGYLKALPPAPGRTYAVQRVDD